MTLILLIIVVAALGFYRWYPWRTWVKVTGTVVDSTTQEPIANARVIVELVAYRVFDEGYVGYGLVTDADGRFSLDLRAPMRYTWLYIHASTPGDNYGFVQVHGHDVIVRTGPIPPNIDEPVLHYKEFRGSIVFSKKVPIQKLIFLDQSW